MTDGGFRGQMVPVCFGCRTPMEEADRPTYYGPLAVVAATGLTTACRYCRDRGRPTMTNAATGQRRTHVLTAWGFVVAWAALALVLVALLT